MLLPSQCISADFTFMKLEKYSFVICNINAHCRLKTIDFEIKIIKKIIIIPLQNIS